MQRGAFALHYHESEVFQLRFREWVLGNAINVNAEGQNNVLVP